MMTPRIAIIQAPLPLQFLPLQPLFPSSSSSLHFLSIPSPSRQLFLASFVLLSNETNEKCFNFFPRTLFASLLQAEEIEKIVLGCLDACRVLSPTRHMKSADLCILHTFNIDSTMCLHSLRGSTSMIRYGTIYQLTGG